MLSLMGMQIVTRTAQQQMRTEIIWGPWYHPKIPPKHIRGKVSRRVWKRKHRSRHTRIFAEPTDAIIADNKYIFLTPRQVELLRKRIDSQEQNTYGSIVQMI